MKKCILFLLGMVLLFSLCSCGGKAAEKQTVQPEGKASAQEAIENGALLYSYDLTKEIVDDIDLAKETYEGRYYLINFIVDSTFNEDYLRGMSECPLFTVKSSVYYAAHLPEEEREGIAPGDIVQVVGKLSAIEKHFNGATFVEFTDAHCVSKILQLSGEVQMVAANYRGERFCSLIDDGVLSPKRGETAVFLPDDCELAAGDHITVTGKLHGGENHAFFANAAYADYFIWMEIPESIEIEGS